MNDSLQDIILFIIACIASLVIFAIILSIFTFPFLCINFHPQNGYKTGVIVKLTESGIFSKTYEAEIIRGGFNSGSGVIGSKFDFTVPADKYQEVNNSFNLQNEVKINYECYLFYSPFHSESNGCYLLNIEKIKGEKNEQQ